jgi:hypothetical protein
MKRRILTLFLALILLPAAAEAQVHKGFKGFRLSITETLLFDWNDAYAFDTFVNEGEDDEQRVSSEYDYFSLVNRFNVGGSNNWLSLGLRFDYAQFFGPVQTPGSDSYDQTLAEKDFDERFGYDASIGDSVRHINHDFSLEKVFIAVRKKEFSLEVGDVYGCLGKGMALCIKKVDELGNDTTLRGGKAIFNSPHLGLTLLGGVTNIVNVGSRVRGRLPDPNDLIVGGEIKLPFLSWLELSGHTAFVKDRERYRENDGDVQREYVWTSGAGLSIPDLAGFGFFVEYDYMAEKSTHFVPNLDLYELTGEAGMGYETEKARGHAVYGMISFDKSIFHMLIEGKWYQGFPHEGAIGKEVDSGAEVHSGSTSDFIYYAVLPPLEDEALFYRSTEFFDVVGGRARFDFEIPKITAVPFASYMDSEWVEGSKTNEAGDVEDYYVRHVLWGWQQRVDKASVVGTVSGGFRQERAGFESSIRHVWHVDGDIQFPLAGPHSLDLGGRFELHDWRDEAQDDFRIAKANLTYTFAPHLALSYIYEYSNQAAGEEGAGHFHAGEITWRFLSGSYLKLFGGSTRGGLRCVGGMCGRFPPFKGVKLELALRF